MFDITLGDTKSWHVLLPFVYFSVLLRVYALRCIALHLNAIDYLRVLQPKPVLLCANVMQSELCFYKLF